MPEGVGRAKGFAVACVAAVLGVGACDGSSNGPSGPSLIDEFPGVKSALLCIENVESYLAVGEDELCTRHLEHHEVTGCVVEYNARLRNRCVDGWPTPALGNTAARRIRVQMSVGAFRGGLRLKTKRHALDVAVEEAQWLCGGDGERPARNCRFWLGAEDLRGVGVGGFEVRRRWNACWLEHRPTEGGLGCYPDPGYPPFPSEADADIAAF